MLQIAEPAVALSDVRVGGHVRMSRTLKIRERDQRECIVGAVANLAAGAPGGRLKSLVLNSHGLPGYMIMGEGFWKPHTGMFHQWKGLVSNVWILACKIASRTPLPPTSHLPGWLTGQTGDGFLFCQEMAQNAGCNVIASLDTQHVPHQSIPNGSIDAFEGRLFCWKPDGSVAWYRKYSRTSLE